MVGKTAEQGHAIAQISLGHKYSHGWAVPKNKKEAAKWYQMAANQGSASAQYSLGKIYYEGKGIEKSLDRAYAWWLISAASGNTGAREQIKTLAKEMTAEQTGKAKQLTFDFLHTIAK